MPRKSPGVAGVLSATAPGLGKVYSGRPLEGLYAMLTVGFMGWLGYEGFRGDGLGSLKGWVFGPVAGVFYLGNVYGSVVAAQVENRRVGDAYLVQIDLSQYIPSPCE